MRRTLLCCLLLPTLPATAALEVVSSELVSRRPDGIGQIVEADLDGDGDRDLLITGRKNDFLGWIESSPNGPVGTLRAINTGTLAVKNTRPMVADLDGDGLPDVHYPGWVLKNRFRKFDAPVANATTAGHELCASDRTGLLGRALDTGVWKIFTSTGATVIQTEEGPLNSPGFSPECCILENFSKDGRLDLVVYLEGARLGSGAIATGTYALHSQANGEWGVNRFTTSKPYATASIHSSNGTLSGNFAIAFPSIDDHPSPPVAGSSLQFRNYDPSATYTYQRWSIGSTHFRGMKITSISGAYRSSASRYEMAAGMTATDGSGVNSIYQLRTDYFSSSILLQSMAGGTIEEKGQIQVFQSSNGSRIHASVGTAAGQTTVAPEALLEYLPGELVIEQSYELPTIGKMTSGPYGPLEKGNWCHLDGDGRDEWVSGTPWPGGVLAIPADAPFSAKDIPLNTPRVPWVYPVPEIAAGPLFAGDLDGDGDIDLARRLDLLDFDGWPNQFLMQWENLDGHEFYNALDPYYDYWMQWSIPGSQPLRLEAGTRPRLLTSQPGMIHSQWLMPRNSQDSYPTPVAYPGTGAAVVEAGHDLDADGARDFIFFPSVFGNALTWGKWNPEGGHLDSMEKIADVPAGLTVPSLVAGDLEGDGTADLFHPALDAAGTQVTWVACRLTAAGPAALEHPPITLPASAKLVAPADLDGDGDIDLLRFVPDAAAPADADGIRPHHLLWTEYVGGTWVHHTTKLGTLRLSAAEPVLRAEGDRLLVINRIGEVLELKTRVTPSAGMLASALAAQQVTGASSGAADDPDGDGFPNYVEILAGTSPVIADRSISLPMQMLRSGPNHGWIASLAAAPSAVGARARLETSDDLVEWTRHEDEPLPLGGSGAEERYLFPDSALAAPPARRFARIAFSHDSE
ncbi:VCBS repeat-containing protein [Luteolibacter flavescens]|uniref:VCBS repeat-containing protein n=1 Tax=Luteolibacter flavescens TaxID=1859460 RepID=A0ABT3FSF6_9BACT|nr:VCBS repeat-containing protein [Luteolibacter flavescens]MCW1886244.1 VCBS repeat-containing protein [Luteolibacter flavescens]